MSSAADSIQWWGTFAKTHSALISAQAVPAPPPYYNAAPPAEPLSSFITRELGQQVPAAAAPVQEAAVVAARAYAGPDPVLHAGYDAAARSRVARRAALLGNQMVPGALVLLRLRRHDTAPDYHSPSVCIGILPVGYDHAASLAVAGGITFDASAATANSNDARATLATNSKDVTRRGRRTCA